MEMRLMLMCDLRDVSVPIELFTALYFLCFRINLAIV